VIVIQEIEKGVEEATKMHYLFSTLAKTKSHEQGKMTLEINNIHSLHTVRLYGTCFNTSNTKTNSCSIGSSNAFFSPNYASTLALVILDSFSSCIGWEAGHVDNFVLENNHHKAFPCPQRDPQPQENDGGE
jgi:hypothetical protein